MTSNNANIILTQCYLMFHTKPDDQHIYEDCYIIIFIIIIVVVVVVISDIKDLPL